jgi:hypothetical protein
MKDTNADSDSRHLHLPQFDSGIGLRLIDGASHRNSTGSTLAQKSKDKMQCGERRILRKTPESNRNKQDLNERHASFRDRGPT